MAPDANTPIAEDHEPPSPPVSPNAYHDAIFEKRRARLIWIREDPIARWRDLKRHYQENIADAINDWGITADPRLVRLGKRSVMPFELFARQRDLVAYWYRKWRAGEYGLTEKSRDVGVSWLACAFEVELCVLFNDITAGLGSYVEEKVDNGSDPGSLFWKVRTYIDWLPVERRAGYILEDHSRKRRVEFPDSNSQILGEVGDNIGRGQRTSIYMVDETAHLMHGDDVDAALSMTTDCRQDMSSVKGMTNSFAQRAHDASIEKFIFDWRDDPRKDAEWYEDFLQKWGPVITAQEVDRNYSASIEGIVIEPLWVEAMVDAHAALGIQMTGQKRGSLDVADKGQDKNAFVFAHGNVVIFANSWSGRETGDIYATVEKAFAHTDDHAGRAFVYDADGLGAGCEGDARKINQGRASRRLPVIDVSAFRGSAGVFQPKSEMVEGRKNEDFFENYKAQAWWSLRTRAQETYRARKGMKYDADMIISISSDIPELAKLKIELSQPQYDRAKSGKMLIVKAPDGTPSPNLADAFMMLFAPKRQPFKISADYLRRSRRLSMADEP